MLHATAGNAAGWERSMRPQTRRGDERESKGAVSQSVAAGCSPSRALAGNQAVLRLRLLAKPGDDGNVIGLQVQLADQLTIKPDRDLQGALRFKGLLSRPSDLSLQECAPAHAHASEIKRELRRMWFSRLKKKHRGCLCGVQQFITERGQLQRAPSMVGPPAECHPFPAG